MRLEDRGTIDISRRLLVAALHPDSTAFANLVRSGAQGVDWGWVLEQASAHKVAGLLAARVEATELAACVTEPIAQRLRAIRQDARERSEMAHATLRELNAACAHADIPLFVVKGSVLAEHVYGDPAMRRFFDVDVVVPEEVVARVETLMYSLGYRLSQVQKLLGAEPRGAAEMRVAEGLTRAFYRRFEYEIPFAAPKGAALLAVDVHWHIAPQDRLQVSARELWQHTTSVMVGDTRVLTLTPAATVIHLAVHATSCAFAGFRLLHLCDVAWAATRLGEAADGVRELAEAWNVAAHLDDVFEMTERVLGVRLPVALRRTHRQRNLLIRAVFDRVACGAFLVPDAASTPAGWWKRAWVELAWSIAMRCLQHNLVRSMRVRICRAQWRWQRWRLHSAQAE